MIDREDWSALWQRWLIWAAAILVALLLFSAKSARAMTREYRVPNECAELAMRASIPVVLTRHEARHAIAKLEQYLIWPGVRECRNAAKRDWGM